MDESWMIYYDAANRLVTCRPDPGAGAIGSNWQPGYTEKEAKAFVAEVLASDPRWERGAMTSPRF